MAWSRYLSNLALRKGEDLLKLDGEGHKGSQLCAAGNTIWTGAPSGDNGFKVVSMGSEVLLQSASCEGMYHLRVIILMIGTTLAELTEIYLYVVRCRHSCL
jgi:hypothetical protein